MVNGKRAARLSADEIASVKDCAALSATERQILCRYYGVGRTPQTDGQIAVAMKMNGYDVRKLRREAQNKVRWTMAKAS